MKRFLFCIIFLGLTCFHLFIHAEILIDFKEYKQNNIQTPLAFISRTEQAPTIDGKMDDLCWKTATQLSLLKEAHTRLAPKEKTYTVICYDQNNLYFFIKAEEKFKNLLRGRKQKKRDVYGGDTIELFIGSETNPMHYYQFCVGLLYGQHYDADSKIGKLYNPEGWVSKVNRDFDKNYVGIEIKIPAQAVGRTSFKKGKPWKFNVARMDFLSEKTYRHWPAKMGPYQNREHSQWSVTGASNNAVAFFGHLVLGKQKSMLKQRSHMQLVLDRDIYDGQDTQGQVVVRLTGQEEPANFKFQISNQKDLVIKAERKIEKNYFSFNFPLKKLQNGTFFAKAIVEKKDGYKVTAEKVFHKEVQAWEHSIIKRGKISLTLPKRNSAKGENWGVRTGVPFPKGCLWDKNKVRLLEDGKEVLCQTDVRGTWSPNGSIRWLGLSFIAKNKNGNYPKYELEYGINGQSSYHRKKLAIEKQDQIVLQTSSLKAIFDKKQYRGLSKAWVDKNKDKSFGMKELIINASLAEAPYIIDRSGTLFSSAYDEQCQIEIEESGPLMAVIKAEGWFVNQDRGKLCKYITYYEIFDGLDYIYVDHAVIMTFDSRKNALRDVAFPIAALGQNGNLGMDGKLYMSDRSTRAFALQERWNVGKIANSKKEKGQKISAWVDAGKENIGVTLFGNYVKERFPKEFSIDKDKITYHLWPRDLGDTFTEKEELERKNIYKLWFAHEGPEMNLNLPDHYAKRLADYRQNERYAYNYNHVIKGLKSNSQGVALNETFLLKLRTSPFNHKKADEFENLYQSNPHALASPKWITESMALGHMIAENTVDFPVLEKFIDKTFLTRSQIGIKMNDEYGLWIYGDMHTYWYPHLNYAGLHRVWMGHHHRQFSLPWLLYARSGKEKFLDWARVTSHKLMNLSIVHYDNPEKPLPFHKKGNVYHVKGFLPWGGDSAAASHMAGVKYLQYKWCMTGSRRARDISSSWVERNISDDFEGNPGRDSINFLGEAIKFYRNSRNPKLLSLINRHAQIVCGIPKLESQHAFFFNRMTFIDYYELTKNKSLLNKMSNKNFIKHFDNFHIGPYLYLKTNISHYLDQVKVYQNNELPYGLFEMVRRFYENSNDPEYDGYSYPRSIVSMVGNLEALMLLQKAYQKSGRKIKLNLSLNRTPIIMSKKFTNLYPYPYSWWVQSLGKDVYVDLVDSVKDLKQIQVLDDQGKMVEGFPKLNKNGKVQLLSSKQNGEFEIKINGERKQRLHKENFITLDSKDQPYIKIQKNKMYGMFYGSIFKINHRENGPLTIKVRERYGKSARLSLLDENFKEIDYIYVWESARNHTAARVRDFTIPVTDKVQYLTANYPITIQTSKTINLYPVTHHINK